MRVTLRSRECRAGDSQDQAIRSPGVWPASTTASARPVSMTIRAFQPRVSASSPAMRLVWVSASLTMLDATQWRASKCRDSPGPRSSNCVQVARPGG